MAGVWGRWQKHHWILRFPQMRLTASVLFHAARTGSLLSPGVEMSLRRRRSIGHGKVPLQHHQRNAELWGQEELILKLCSDHKRFSGGTNVKITSFVMELVHLDSNKMSGFSPLTKPLSTLDVAVSYFLFYHNLRPVQQFSRVILIDRAGILNFLSTLNSGLYVAWYEYRNTS